MGPRILFVCDSGAEIGGGHVMRCLTLARAFMDRGAECAFLAPPHAEQVLATFAPKGVEAIPVKEADMLSAAAMTAADALVFDHFRIGATQQRAAAAGRPCLAVDDLADRPLHADLVVDPGPDRRPVDYKGLLPAEAQLLLGPAYALVRQEFAALRKAALVRRHGPVRRILVSLGLTDVDGVTGRVVEALLPSVGEAAITAVVGRAAPSLSRLQTLQDPRLRVVVEARDMAELMADADLAVGAGGSTTWERCTLGLPTLLLVLADNQAPSANALAHRGAARVLDVRRPNFAAAFAAAAEALLADDAGRRQMAEAAAELCDGLGAARAAAAFLDVVASSGPP